MVSFGSGDFGCDRYLLRGGNFVRTVAEAAQRFLPRINALSDKGMNELYARNNWV